MSKKLSFKYSHKDKLSLIPSQKFTILILLVLMLFFTIIYIQISIALLVITFIYTLIVLPKRNLYLAPRYLICGNTIFYYKDITKMTLNSNLGLLIIYSEGREIFRLEKDLFPTNARKTDKIINNKKNKFKKISEKIIGKITSVLPNVELERIN